MKDDELQEFRELWAAPPGTYEVVIFDDGEAMLACQVDPPSAILIEDDELNARVCRRMVAAGVSLRQDRSACVVGGCGENAVEDRLCTEHLRLFYAAQAARERDGHAPLTPQSWADVEHRRRKRE